MKTDEFGFDVVGEEDTPTGTDLERLVPDEQAARQRERRLADATRAFDWNQLDTSDAPPQPIIAANDNDPVFKQKESWALMEALKRVSFESDPGKRSAMREAVLYLLDLVNVAETDAVGHAVHRPGKEPTSDFNLQRTKQGKIDWEGARITLDRKPRRHGHEVRYDGPVRKAEICSPGALSDGYDSGNDELFSQTRIDAQMKLDDIKAIVGPLWRYLHDAIVNRATFTNIAAGLGFSQPVVGSVLVKLALEAALDPVRILRAEGDFRQFVQQNELPVPVSRFSRAVRMAA